MVNFTTILKDNIEIPKLTWNKRYVNSVGSEFLTFHLQNGYFKQTRTLSPKNVIGSPKLIRLRTQLLNDTRMTNKISNHIFKEFRYK